MNTNNNIYRELLALMMHQIHFEFSRSLETGDISPDDYNRIVDLKKLELFHKYSNYLKKEVN